MLLAFRNLFVLLLDDLVDVILLLFVALREIFQLRLDSLRLILLAGVEHVASSGRILLGVQLLLKASQLDLFVLDVLDEAADLRLRGLAIVFVLGLSVSLTLRYLEILVILRGEVRLDVQDLGAHRFIFHLNLEEVFHCVVALRLSAREVTGSEAPATSDS